MRDICAGIVLFNPNIKRLEENINSIINQCAKVLLVDNGSENVHEIEELCGLYNNLSIIKNKTNKGIAKAINQILEFAKANSYSWFLTLDQDSVCASNIIEFYNCYINNQVGQLTCNILDRNTGYLTGENSLEGYHECGGCITSGALNNTEALISVGGATEELFIDGVDLDISCKLIRAGYKILHIHFDGLLHELGEGEIHRIFGKTVVTSNHKPWRNYYARRNLIYVARKYYSGRRKVKSIFKQIIYAIGTVILEDQKLERVKYNMKGIFDGLTMKIS